MRHTVLLATVVALIGITGALAPAAYAEEGAAPSARDLFMRGELPRGEASKVMNMSERSARRIVSQLLKEGLAESDSHRAPLRIGLPTRALPFYFPNLYDASVLGEGFHDLAVSTHD